MDESAPAKNASTTTVVPSSLGVTCVAVAANVGSAAMASSSRWMAAVASALWTSPVMTIFAGSVRLPLNSRCSVRNAALDGNSSGSWLTFWDVPRFSWK